MAIMSATGLIDDAARLLTRASTRLTRASTQLGKGQSVAARHLLGSASRDIVQVRSIAWPGGDLTEASRSVLALLSESIEGARGMLRPSTGAADVVSATTLVNRSRFLVDLLLPG